MEDNPTVHEVTQTTSTLPLTSTSTPNSDPSCIFCTILKTYPPISPLTPTHPSFNPDLLSPPTYILLSTPHLLALLDIAPLTRGHILLLPRPHRTKIGHLSPRESAHLARVLPLVARAVMASVLPDLHHDEADYNVVQNNGPGAAQVVPHVHFHVIPRPPLGYQLPSSSSSTCTSASVTPAAATAASSSSPSGATGREVGVRRRKYAPAQIPTGLKASFIQFGRGQRSELDDDDAVELIKIMRENVRREWIKEFGECDDETGGGSPKGKL